MGKVSKLRMIWAMFKLYLNNPNYYVRQDDVLADLFMQGEYDVERFCHSLGVTPQRGLTFGQLLKNVIYYEQIKIYQSKRRKISIKRK